MPPKTRIYRSASPYLINELTQEEEYTDGIDLLASQSRSSLPTSILEAQTICFPSSNHAFFFIIINKTTSLEHGRDPPQVWGWSEHTSRPVRAAFLRGAAQPSHLRPQPVWAHCFKTQHLSLPCTTTTQQIQERGCSPPTTTYSKTSQWQQQQQQEVP